MSFFNNSKIDEESKRNLAFQTIVAHRDLLQLASKKQQPPTYENALGLLNELAPELYSDFIELLTRRNESELVQYFKDLSEIKSQETGKDISPIELIERQIKTLQDLHDQDPSKKTVSKRLMEHLVAREKMEPVRLTENRILNRDFNQVDRTTYSDKLFQNDFFSDYKLKNSNVLRIRFLHPDSDEHITGADLIYEQYDLKNNKVRFVFLQYKTWDKNVIYKSATANLVPQLEKMTSILCNNKLCHTSSGTKTSTKYRLPYCSGFLRPTDKIQESDSKLISTGYHLPICNALKLIENEGKIEKKMIKEESFKSHIFEELFNNNMIGTRWIDVETLEKIYEENQVFKKSERIKLYAQEIIK
ncbi:hypothetical protein [Tenacibaculum geojense]|uniref:Uncharacterized protein n=1 Tax=Tenacibaculum geojense TaxID=915352 RepID=A0ABW3JVQ5_9FLAO